MISLWRLYQHEISMQSVSALSASVKSDSWQRGKCWQEQKRWLTAWITSDMSREHQHACRAMADGVTHSSVQRKCLYKARCNVEWWQSDNKSSIGSDQDVFEETVTLSLANNASSLEAAKGYMCHEVSAAPNSARAPKLIWALLFQADDKSLSIIFL